jgi:flagellar hook-associated protein 1
MGSLFGALGTALSSLLANEGAIQVTANNIANANTPGYSRQQVNLTESAPLIIGSLVLGSGVSLESVQSVRDQVLELQIQQQLQDQGQVNAFAGGINQVQALFNETQGSGLQNVLSQFFASLQSLSTDPTSLTLRQAVLDAGQNLADEFNSLASGLQQAQSGLDQSVPQTVGQINQLTSQIATVNAQIAQLQPGAQTASGFIDQRNQLIEQLSNLVGVSVISANDGTVTLTTTAGTPLVVEQQSFALQSQVDPSSGLQHVFAQGVDITSSLTGGELGGTLQARDQAIPAVETQLDNLAAGLGSAFNAQSAAGFDLSGAPGGNFFVPFVQPSPGSNAGAAAQFGVAITDPSKIAASSDGTAGSNGNALALAALQNQPLVDGQTVTGYYASMIGSIGSQAANALSQQQAEQLVVQQLQNQQASVSGVSLDEEAANLVQFQNAYDAAARVFSIVDQLTQTAISLGSQGAS